jgi:hypothetical protein
MDKIRSKWDFLLQCRPDVRGIVGNAKLIGGHIGHNDNHEKVFNFIITKGTFSYNEMTHKFKSKLQIRWYRSKGVA